jgi:ATP synthase F1 complex assembly factor 2
LQNAHWKPLIEWASKTFKTEIKVYEGILNTRQSDDTILKLGAVVEQYDQFKLAGEQGSSAPAPN